MTQDETAAPDDFVRRHPLGPDRSQPTAAHRVAQKLAAMRTRCAALEVEAADSTARMHAEREKTDAALLALEATRDELATVESKIDAARAIPAHSQAFIDDVRTALGAPGADSATAAERVSVRLACVSIALDLLDEQTRGAR